MFFQRINQNDPERAFIAVYNSYSTASLTNGQAVMWDYATDADGVSVTKPAAINGIAAAGVAVQTIAAGAYGLIQVYGKHDAVRVRSVTGGSPAVAAGIPLAMQNAVFCLESYATNYASTVAINTKFPCGFALAANALYTTAAIAVFLKCL